MNRDKVPNWKKQIYQNPQGKVESIIGIGIKTVSELKWNTAMVLNKLVKEQLLVNAMKIRKGYNSLQNYLSEY